MSRGSGVQRKRQIVRWSAAIGILLLDAAVRLVGLDRHGLWYDEIVAALRARESMSWQLRSELLRTWPLLYILTKAGFLRDVVAAPPMGGPFNARSSGHVLDYYPVPARAEFRIVTSTDDVQELCADHRQAWLILTPPYTRALDPPAQWASATVFSFCPQFRIIYRDCPGAEAGGQ